MRQRTPSPTTTDDAPGRGPDQVGDPLPSFEPLPRDLTEALLRAQAWGFLGSGVPLQVHVDHAHGFADAAEAVEAGMLGPAANGTSNAGPWLDLGSGGGIPGLVLAHQWPQREGVLLDSNQRRARFLTEVVKAQGWADRIRVVADRAETAGRVESLRGAFSLVVARSFGAPPVTAECSAPFLRQEGILIVSEPPTSSPTDSVDDGRWPVDGLARVGLEPYRTRRGAYGYRVLRQKEQCPEDFPRRVGLPGKRPLYRVGVGPHRGKSGENDGVPTP